MCLILAASMKKASILISLLTLTLVCLVAAQNQPKEKPKTWPEKAAEKFKDNPTPEHRATIDANLPSRSVDPRKERRVLVFYRCEGFIHTSIPFGNYAMEALARETKAFRVDLADDYSVFTKENLAQYDGILFNNTTHLKPDELQRKAILDFAASGKGIIGFHAAADNFNGWDEGIAMIGGIFDGHPWTAGGTWAFKVEDPDHPLNAAFKGKGLWQKDEIYWYKKESFEGREKLRVLLSLDMSKPKNAEPFADEKWKGKVEDPTQIDVPVSWCRELGKGRLFYTNLGHNNMTFADKTVLQHMLDGIQYALGDLEADAIPSAEIKVEIVAAPDTVPDAAP